MERCAATINSKMADSQDATATEVDVEAILRATASDDDSSDGEDGTGLVQGMGEEGMQVAIRNGDEPAEQSEDEEGEGEEMEVLDPSHPLMQRVQLALQAQLTRQNEKLEVELREKSETLRSHKTERERLGVELYGLQQQLARQQMLLEKEQDQVSSVNSLRKQTEEALQQERSAHHAVQEQLKKQHKNSEHLRTEMDTLRAKLHYLTTAHDALQTDISVTKRATEKADVDMTQAQVDKEKQDMYVDRLTEEVQRAEEQVALYKAQCSTQSQDTQAVKEALSEAAMELETLELEKKKLFQQWNNSLIGMQRRDEAYAAMLAALRLQRDQSQSMDTEIESYKKAILKEQEENEQLTGMLRKLEADIAHVKKQIEASHAKREQLKMEYMMYTRTLQETEEVLGKTTTDYTLHQNELKTLRTLIEREALEKRKMEDSVMEKMLYQLTMDKATQHTKKTVEKMRLGVKQLETDLTKSDNETATLEIQMSHLQSKLEGLQQQMDAQNTHIEEQNALITQSEAEIARNNHLIERKQTQIDQLNKKISQMMTKTEGVEELGPMEIKILELQKSISDSAEACMQMEQHWLRQQSELVRKTRDADQQSHAVEKLNRELLILGQKRLRLDAEVEMHERDILEVTRGIESLHKDTVKLNGLITLKRGEQEGMQQSNVLVESDFVNTLKEAELESIQMQTQLDQIREERRRLQNSIMEAEKQVMLWERKIQLSKEMKQTVDSEAGQAEIRGMQAEIHRMEVHYAELKRKQERLIQDMEKAVYRRETIILKGEAQTKAGKVENTKGHLRKKIEEARKKLKQTTDSTAFCGREAKALQASQGDLSRQLEERQQTCHQLQATAEALEEEAAQLSDTKQLNLHEIVAHQQRAKHLGAVKDGRYKMAVSTSELEAESRRQEERLRTLLSMADRLAEDFPHAAPALRRVHHMAGWKLGECERSQQQLATSSEQTVELA